MDSLTIQEVGNVLCLLRIALYRYFTVKKIMQILTFVNNERVVVKFLSKSQVVARNRLEVTAKR